MRSCGSTSGRVLVFIYRTHHYQWTSQASRCVRFYVYKGCPIRIRAGCWTCHKYDLHYPGIISNSYCLAYLFILLPLQTHFYLTRYIISLCLGLHHLALRYMSLRMLDNHKASLLNRLAMVQGRRSESYAYLNSCIADGRSSQNK